MISQKIHYISTLYPNPRTVLMISGFCGSSSSFSLNRLIYTVKVLSFTKSPAISQIASRSCVRDKTIPRLPKNTSNNRYSNADRCKSYPFLLTIPLSTSTIILPSQITELAPPVRRKIFLIRNTSSLGRNGFAI